MKMKKVVIIGSGFSAIASACYMAKAGYSVQVLEKKRTTWRPRFSIRNRGIQVRYGTKLVLDAGYFREFLR